jgi:phosphatidylethanolamine/phosphatidyl-N-methylethanolamine N-methyltransferase
MASDAVLFFGLWLRKPLQIAAICPSGAPLAVAMAQLVDPARPGLLLELGAGTGSLTRGLVEAGWPPERILAHEGEAGLAEILPRDFPGITTIVGDARDLGRQLDRRMVGRLSVVVSSLPIKWFSLEAQQAVLGPCFERLAPEGCFLQVTNAFSSPLPIERLGICGREVARVWRNMPPAQIWCYRARTGGGGDRGRGRALGEAS